VRLPRAAPTARAGAILALVGLAMLAGGAARAEMPPAERVIDRVAARFYAPETGGPTHPRFVAERTLAFEARLVMLSEVRDGVGDGFEDRHVREALEHHVAESMLASLARKLLAGSAPGKRPTDEQLADIERDVRAALLERLGGEPRVMAAAAAEQLEPAEVEVVLKREALAAWYLDRAVLPVLAPTDEELREVLRTSANPFRGQAFDLVRPALQRWYVAERLRAAESTFLQAARSRVVIAVSP
jgi:hypothetical protein